MDPVSALGLASSLPSLIETTVQIIGYVNDVKDAPSERAQFARHASSLLAMLTDLRYRVEESQSTSDAWFRATRSLGTEGGPLDQLRDQLERLATKFEPPRRRLQKVGRALIWTLDKKEIEEVLRQIEQVKTLDVPEAIDGAVTARQDEEFHEITAWLSSLDFADKQADNLNRGQVDTGDWFFHWFEKWLAGEEKMLWCPGLPGAAKTVLASKVIDMLEREFQGMDDFAVIYLYCNYKEEEVQTVQNLMGSLLKQVVKHKHALDECPEHNNTRGRLLDEIQKLPSNARILVTSTYSPEINERFEHVPAIYISAADEDVERYIEARIEKEKFLKRHVETEPDLMEEIIKTVVERSEGMFLLAQLHMDNLARKLNCRELRRALRGLPKEFDEVYGQAMQRIHNQDEDQVVLAHKVLWWISYSPRPLTVTELQHALAVEPGDDDLDEDGIYDKEFMVSVCAGLVTVDEESDQIRLVHYTAESYFHRVRTSMFPEGPSSIIKACFTYLTFSQFEDKHGRTVLRRLLDHHPFLMYAVSDWSHHVRDGMTQDVRELALEHVRKNTNTQLNLLMEMRQYKGRCLQSCLGKVKGSTPLHVVVWLGLVVIADDLLVENVDLNAQVYEGITPTPLHLAASQGHTQMVSWLLQQGATIAAKADLEYTPLHLIVEMGHLPVVQVLLDAGADYVEQLSDCQTPLVKAARCGNEALVLLLLDKGADPSATSSWSCTALHTAAAIGCGKIMKTLISSGIDISQTDDLGRTALHLAADKGNEEAGQILLSNKANAFAKEYSGKTAVHLAADWAHDKVVELFLKHLGKGGETRVETERLLATTRLRWAFEATDKDKVRSLLKQGADPNFRFNALRPLSHLAATRKDMDLLQLLLTNQSSVDMRDSDGLTALLWAAHGDDEVGVRLLLEYGADIEAPDCKGAIPLHWAAAYGSASVAKRLLVNGRQWMQETSLNKQL
ncbi:hypothetical protein AYL99_08441 [Fonsecaea erecta]|uniref:Uncharacterized protein n=1 Tax=Fonsecaea erecta TaxID=1367422 RepID=A0A178ZEU4_9EURO|nr:hypothetical protein AYL99_08441 [Fonsecaea erecta]OAP57703.1 hypothetical protein AYL99_08441 [Fonsecaea erecta]